MGATEAVAAPAGCDTTALPFAAFRAGGDVAVFGAAAVRGDVVAAAALAFDGAATGSFDAFCAVGAIAASVDAFGAVGAAAGSVDDFCAAGAGVGALGELFDAALSLLGFVGRPGLVSCGIVR